jgi:hypothetical protein
MFDGFPIDAFGFVRRDGFDAPRVPSTRSDLPRGSGEAGSSVESPSANRETTVLNRDRCLGFFMTLDRPRPLSVVQACCRSSDDDRGEFPRAACWGANRFPIRS